MPLLHEKERAEGKGINSGAVERADGGTGIGDKRFSKEIEASVDENWSGGRFADFVQ